MLRFNRCISFQLRCLAAWLALSVVIHSAEPHVFADELKLLSPDGQVQFVLLGSERRELEYQVLFRGQPVIEPSRLGITVDGVDLGRDVEIGRPDSYQVTSEKYPWNGVHSEAVNNCNGAKIPVRQRSNNTSFTLEVRAYNDGVGFRHLVPGDDPVRVPDEATSFTIPAGSSVWLHDFGGHYEGIHARKEIDQVKPDEWAATPLTIRLPDDRGFASITEAGLVNYSGLALQAGGRRVFQSRLGHAPPINYPFRLRYGEEEGRRLSKPAAVGGTISTPWRVILISANLHGLVNSDVISNLSPAPDSKLFPQQSLTEWVKPGRCVWKFLDGGQSSFEGMKEFSRLAGQLGFEYNLIEGFWQKWSDSQLRELVDYSARQNVRIWLWKHRKDIGTAEQRREFFQKCRDLGIAGVKLDFFDHEAKEVIDLYQACLRDAAEFHLMVDFHGANKPAGEARTWPNEMTREGIYGLEHRRTKEWARHNSTLPFTRMLSGHGDYTPVVFGERRLETSWAHQIATAAVFTSPLLVYGGHPKSLLENPAVEIIKRIPSVWDETIVLPSSEIGELTAFARRRGNTWFIAVLNGPSERTLRVPLTFLGSGKYQCLAARDQMDRADAIQIAGSVSDRETPLTIEMRPGGGFIAMLSHVDSANVGQ